MAIDFGLAARPDANAYLGPLQAMAAGRQAALETRRAAARQAALGQASQGDLVGGERTALAGGDTETADYIRAAQARAAAGQVISLNGTPNTGAPAVSQSPVQALISAGTPGAQPAPRLASGALPAAPATPPASNPAPAGADPLAPLPEPQSPMADHTHEATAAIGHAALSGQEVDPTQAWAHLYSLDPAMGDKMMAAVGSMDKLRVGRLAETTDALANAAQSLVGVPAEQRAAQLQRLAPALAAHGVTADMLANADLSDNGLAGIIGQSIGVKGMLDQANKNVEHGFEGRKLDQTDASQAEEVRHNRATEAQGGIKTLQPGESIVDTGAGSGLSDPASVAARIAQVEGTGKNPNSSAAGVGQFTNSTFLRCYKQYIGNNGLSDAQILAQKGDPKTAGYLLECFTKENQDGLQQRGIAPTPTNTYLAHFLGMGGATTLLGADPSTKASAILPANVIAANPFLRGKTVAQVQSWAASKMGDGGGSRGPRVIASNDTASLSGDAIESAAAIYVKTGQLPAGVARTKGDIDKILNKAADIQKAVGNKPGDIVSNWQDFKTQSNALKEFNSTRPGSGGAMIRSLNVATDHIAALAGAVQALNNGDTPLFNRIANGVAKATGKPAPTNFAALKGFVTDEVNKAILGGAGGVGDREQAHAIVDAANSPQQLFGAIGQLQRLMSGQLDGLRQQYVTGTGRNDFERFISPGTRKTLEHFHPAQRDGTPADIAAIMHKYGAH